MNASVHFATIGAMILCGLGMGTAFDVYRVACSRFSVRRWMLPGFDVVYWAAATLVVFRVLLARNEGEVRLYVFLGIAIGITGYFGLLSPTVIKLVGALFRAVRSVLLFVWRAIRVVLIVPVLWIVRTLARLIDIVFVVTAALLLWIGRPLFKPVAKLGKWIWRLLLPVRERARPIAEFFRSARAKWRAILELLKRKD
ncbi:spore cortex biosynthesis protein YabQ [Cohnella xylanilytica]|uniref:Spore cortex biosynthesis protein YabQ n=1 Tax=Cohnella xylanilytica TaxID=557555 RepID=A0A841UC01_9BACL|nr:spore cortex biosynthesis protein YabQ [Cohnella xylanilytica]MBB6695684.1 spore cortex biosynthesis protein YabQ [Cohnella xylanilytica]